MTDEGKNLLKASLATMPVGVIAGIVVYYSLAPMLRIGFYSFSVRLMTGQLALMIAAGFVVPVLAEKIGGFAGQALWVPLLVGAAMLIAASLLFAAFAGITLGLVPLGVATAGFILGGVGGMAWVNAS